jgi:hypothetical protein
LKRILPIDFEDVSGHGGEDSSKWHYDKVCLQKGQCRWSSKLKLQVLARQAGHQVYSHIKPNSQTSRASPRLLTLWLDHPAEDLDSWPREIEMLSVYCFKPLSLQKILKQQ